MDKYNNNASQAAITDCGPGPFVINIGAAAMGNTYFRTTLWTGQHLQVTLMCIPVGSDIGLEVHDVDQYFRVEGGRGIVMMGSSRDNLSCRVRVGAGCAIFIPAGTWHNIFNSSGCPLKLFSLYAPPQHPPGTVHETKAIAEAAEHNH